MVEDSCSSRAVIEFTMHAKPGRYADVLAAYSEFAQAFQEAVPADRLILITGDPASGLIRGIGVFTEKQIAADVYSMPFFAEFNDSISDLIPHYGNTRALRVGLDSPLPGLGPNFPILSIAIRGRHERGSPCPQRAAATGRGIRNMF